MINATLLKPRLLRHGVAASMVEQGLKDRSKDQSTGRLHRVESSQENFDLVAPTESIDTGLAKVDNAWQLEPESERRAHDSFFTFPPRL